MVRCNARSCGAWLPESETPCGLCSYESHPKIPEHLFKPTSHATYACSTAATAKMHRLVDAT